MVERLLITAPDGASLAGERLRGPGPSLLLLHAGVADRRAWRDVAAGLNARGANVVSYDRRGFGETAGTTASFRHVEDLAAVLDEVAGGPAWLVGNSQGGRIALDLALEQPARVAGLVLISPVVSGAPEPETDALDPPTRALGTQIDRAYEAGDLEALNRLEVELWLDGPGGPAGRVGGDARVLALEMNAIALAADQPEDEGAADLDVWSRLDEIHVPATIAWGSLDLPVLIERCHELSSRLPAGHRTIELPSVAHLPALERPDLVIDLVTEAVGI